MENFYTNLINFNVFSNTEEKVLKLFSNSFNECCHEGFPMPRNSNLRADAMLIGSTCINEEKDETFYCRVIFTCV